ncbi:DUF4363 family protein [Acetivibrio straminisolvens]|jgi:predicted PurR-regulated permease PerM|uniref:DUF4363 family protein n=1 Tax=Acetivibrio straminisolvens JCM 21531 TaxID=1294263 RepID=W4VB93_9FIRM|nr:DUF4363 family protein [Acetivibrio straminisolvens]GAE90014.1 hypothetical protein JCM21531_3593 [Acetivibrio straminisolvens JCM 21531]
MHSAKILTGLALLCVIIVGTSLYASSVFSRDAQMLEDWINAIEESIEKEDWTTAENNLTAVREEWDKVEKLWAVLLDHVEIDNIDTSLVRASEYVKSRNISMAMSEIAVLRNFIKHIPENQFFSLKNIL